MTPSGGEGDDSPPRVQLEVGARWCTANTADDVRSDDKHSQLHQGGQPRELPSALTQVAQGILSPDEGILSPDQSILSPEASRAPDLAVAGSKDDAGKRGGVILTPWHVHLQRQAINRSIAQSFNQSVVTIEADAEAHAGAEAEAAAGAATARPMNAANSAVPKNQNQQGAMSVPRGAIQRTPEGSVGSHATASTWRVGRRLNEQGGPNVNRFVLRASTTVVTWRPETERWLEAVRLQAAMRRMLALRLCRQLRLQLRRAEAAARLAVREAEERARRAARRVDRKPVRRAGRADAAGEVPATEKAPEAAAVRTAAATHVQAVWRGALARRLLVQQRLKLRQAEARVRLAARESEELDKIRAKAAGLPSPAAVEATARARRREGAATCIQAAARGRSGRLMLGSAGAEHAVAVTGACKEEATVAEVDARWKDWMAAVRASAVMLCQDAHRRLQEAVEAQAAAEEMAAEANARAAQAEALAVRAEKDREEMRAQLEDMAAALENQSAAAVPRRKLAVVEASDWEAEAATQTEAEAPGSRSEAGCQTTSGQQEPGTAEVSDAAAQTVGAVATIVTQTADEAAVGSTEVVIGRQLHPAQAKAVERAERAAARLEQLEAEAEAKAARYRTESGSAAQETAPTAGSTVGSPEKAAARGGGRQVEKARVRRQAAAAGMDVKSWQAERAWHRQQLAEVVGSDEDSLERVEHRLEMQRDEWLARQQAGAYVGEAESSRRFWHAARGSGIDISVLDTME